MTEARPSAVEVVRRAFQALNDRDRETFLDLHADDVLLHVGDQAIRGAETVADEEWSHFDAFPDLAVEPDQIVADDAMVAVRWTAAGTHEGDFRGISPTGTRVDYQLMGMFRVEDGELTQVWLVADRLALLQQIGAIARSDWLAGSALEERLARMFARRHPIRGVSRRSGRHAPSTRSAAIPGGGRPSRSARRDLRGFGESVTPDRLLATMRGKCVRGGARNGD